MTTYLADAATEAGSEFPFSGLEAAFDAVSRRHLASTGLGRGWDCWEVGAGGGSMACWMADRVGPSGSVVATDVDVTEMASGARSNLGVMEHDLVWDPLPAGRYHCIHARLVLGHLREREGLLERLASALVPGGWLVIEDLDLVLPPCSEMATPDQRLVHKVRSAFSERLGTLREDSGWARKVAARLQDLGLLGVGASAHQAPVRGGSVVASIERTNLGSVREHLVAFGAATEEELDRCLRLLGDPEFRFTMPPMVSAWGQRG